MQIRALVFAGAAMLALGACGNNAGEQALFGAGTGLAGAAIADGNLATGAAIGAAGNVAYCQTYPHRCRR
jgi:hypothetical protein